MLDHSEGDTLLDDLDPLEQRGALRWLIEQLPKVSEMKAMLDTGGQLSALKAPAGSIGALRWVVGTCPAYIKESKAGEGVLPTDLATQSSRYQDTRYEYQPEQTLRQYTIVVGSPQQEMNFKQEIENAKLSREACKTYPTMLAFHGEPASITLTLGSAAERWHNILRTGLDFSEVACGRVGRGWHL
jgi:ubiquitin-conjugating enzyme E2 Q